MEFLVRFSLGELLPVQFGYAVVAELQQTQIKQERAEKPF